MEIHFQIIALSLREHFMLNVTIYRNLRKVLRVLKTNYHID